MNQFLRIIFQSTRRIKSFFPYKDRLRAVAKWLRSCVELSVETAMIFVAEKLKDDCMTEKLSIINIFLIKLDKRLNEIESQPGLFVVTYQFVLITQWWSNYVPIKFIHIYSQSNIHYSDDVNCHDFFFLVKICWWILINKDEKCYFKACVTLLLLLLLKSTFLLKLVARWKVLQIIWNSDSELFCRLVKSYATFTSLAFASIYCDLLSVVSYIYSAIIFQHHCDRGFFSSFGHDEA